MQTSQQVQVSIRFVNAQNAQGKELFCRTKLKKPCTLHLPDYTKDPSQGSEGSRVNIALSIRRQKVLSGT